MDNSMWHFFALFFLLGDQQFFSVAWIEKLVTSGNQVPLDHRPAVEKSMFFTLRITVTPVSLTNKENRYFLTPHGNKVISDVCAFTKSASWCWFKQSSLINFPLK